MKKFLNFLRELLSVVLICIGLTLVFYPTAMTFSYQWKAEQYVHNYEKKHRKQINKEDDPMYHEIVRYNKRIYQNGQKDFKDAWIAKQTPISLPIDKKFGYIQIKSIDVKLPLYIGATDRNLSKGAAILGGTSIPVGMMNCNSAIAAHRGYSGIPFFRNIEGVKIGDKVVIRNPWEKITYVVTSIDIIHPNDIERVKIQPGKDMITLITCHPYRSHGKFRYLVFCERKGTESLGKDYTKGKNQKEEFLSSEPDIKRENIARLIALGFSILLILKKLLDLFRWIQERKKKE